jgi:TRAP-type C4-dicarboxylate transport system substrate-binding protein
MSFLRTVVPLLAATLLLALPSADAQDSITMKIATVAPDGTPWADGLARYKAQVDASAGNKVKIKVFGNGVLGDENETVQQTARGQIQGVGASTGAIASIVPELNVLELPRLFRSAEEADYVLDKVILPTVEKAFRDRGLVLGFWSENGYRCFGTNYGFITSPAALKGRKMRAQESAVHLEMYRAFGASPVPIPVTEVLTSLQTGVVDGYDNTPLFAFAAQWTSSTKYLTISNHIYQPAAIAFNKTWFDALSADQQKILLGARGTLMQSMRKEIRAMVPILVQNLQAMKVQVYTPSATELAAFDGPAKTARDTYMGKASAGEKALYAQIEKGLTDYRAGKR